MHVKEMLDIRTITVDYYSCNFVKVDGDVSIDFGQIKLVFNICRILKCGYPNEEIYMHYDYYTQGSMRKYLLYEIMDSDWIKDLYKMNKVHPRHSEKIFEKDRHFIILFEDEVFECIASNYSIK
jgi:hypothetical protein